jgi:type I restriction enzyme S subunit
MKEGATLSLPKGWEIKKLGDVCDTGAGGTPLKTHKDYYEGGTIPWLLSGEVSQGEIFEAKNFITEKGLKNSSAKLFPPNTVLVAMYGATAGQVGILRFEAATNQAVCGILPNDKAIPEFLFYCFLSKKEELVAQAVGGAQPNISQIKIKNTKIPLPPLPEQQRIVSILDRAFAAIDKAKANAEQNLKNAKELFESYLQGIVSNGDQWEKKTLAQIAKTFGRGKSKHRPRNWEGLYGGDYPFIQTGDIRNSKHYITEYSQTYNEVGLAQSKLWPAGTICITIAANIAETGVLTFDACFPDSVIGIVVNEKVADREFVEYLLQSFKVRIQALGKGSAQANINLGTFENELFPFPTVSEQKEIVDKLNQLFNECERLENVFLRKIDDLEELKKSILQKAFAGELEIKIAIAV